MYGTGAATRTTPVGSVYMWTRITESWMEIVRPGSYTPFFDVSRYVVGYAPQRSATALGKLPKGTGVLKSSSKMSRHGVTGGGMVVVVVGAAVVVVVVVDVVVVDVVVDVVVVDVVVVGATVVVVGATVVVVG